MNFSWRPISSSPSGQQDLDQASPSPLHLVPPSGEYAWLDLLDDTTACWSSFSALKLQRLHTLSIFYRHLCLVDPILFDMTGLELGDINMQNHIKPISLNWSSISDSSLSHSLTARSSFKTPIPISTAWPSLEVFLEVEVDRFFFKRPRATKGFWIVLLRKAVTFVNNNLDHTIFLPHSRFSLSLMCSQ